MYPKASNQCSNDIEEDLEEEEEESGQEEELGQEEEELSQEEEELGQEEEELGQKEEELSQEEEELGQEEEELGQQVVETNRLSIIDKDNCDDDEEEEYTVDEEEECTDDEDNDDYDNDDNDDDNDGDKRSNGKPEDVGIERPRKKKSKTLISNYEFTPRVPTPSIQKAEISEPSSGGKNVSVVWTEMETFALLDAWGKRFLDGGRKSIRAKEWEEVSEKVSQVTNIERTNTQCRNRLDTLKKKYKKEKARLFLGEINCSDWVFYRKMDMLLSSPTEQQSVLSCGIDSGEYVFMNPNVYLNRANGLDEMKDSPAYSGSLRGEENDSDRLPPKKRRRNDQCSSSVGLLADCILKCCEVYERVEIDKGNQMVELEKMRMDFYREIETQRREILDRAMAEIVKVRQAHDNDNGNGNGNENHSG